jgi:hypothetical protein
MNISELLYLGCIPIVLGLTQVFKQWVTDTRWYTLIAIILAVIINVTVSIAQALPLLNAVLMGVVAGLAASGVYSGTSTIKEGPVLANKADRTDDSPPVKEERV